MFERDLWRHEDQRAAVRGEVAERLSLAAESEVDQLDGGEVVFALENQVL